MKDTKLHTTKTKRKNPTNYSYMNNWAKDKKISFSMKFDKQQDKEIIDKLRSVNSITDYIRQLILNDIKK